MVSKPTGRPKGRPPLPLREDPERYWLSRYAAECLLSPSVSDRGIAVMMTAVRFGELTYVSEAAKLGNPEGVLGFRFASPDVRGRAGGASESRRNSSAFHPRADDLARKARRLLNNDCGADDGRWFLAMTQAWIATLAVKAFKAAWLLASSRCFVAGEIAFFKRVMEPIIESRFQLGPEPRFSAPDFIPHDSA